MMVNSLSADLKTSMTPKASAGTATKMMVDSFKLARLLRMDVKAPENQPVRSRK